MQIRKKEVTSHDEDDITHVIFFKKLHVIFYKIASYLAKLDNNIGDKDICLFNFWDELYDNKYFDDNKAFIQIKYIKLTNNIYQISVPVKNSQIAIISYINIS